MCTSIFQIIVQDIPSLNSQSEQIIIGKMLYAAFALGWSEIRQKTQRCRKNAYDSLENVYYL